VDCDDGSGWLHACVIQIAALILTPQKPHRLARRKLVGGRKNCKATCSLD